MTDIKFNSSNSQQRMSSHSAINCDILLPNAASRERDFEFSTSSVHNISDGGAFLDLDDASYDNVSTSAILHYCKLKVLKPYFRMHSLLGWRPLFHQAQLFENKLWIRIINWIYTAFILSFIITGYLLQYSSCYRQDGLNPFIEPSQQGLHSHALETDLLNAVNSSDLTSNEQSDEDNVYEIRATLDMKSFQKVSASKPYFSNSTLNMVFTNKNNTFSFSSRHGISAATNPDTYRKCSGNLFAMYLIPFTLHFFAYLFVLHLMRTPESERLENLMERGFLQTSRTTGWFLAHRKLVNSLRGFLWLCVAWLFISLSIHGLEMGAHLVSDEIDYTWLNPSQHMKIVLVVLTICTLTWNDLICGAIVTSYAVHCQLNISYIINLCASIRERRLEFQVRLAFNLPLVVCQQLMRLLHHSQEH